MNPIVSRIAKTGCVPFARFMEMALYDPEFGYYSAPRSGPGPVGEGGDFVTAPTVEPLFARVMARLVARVARGAGEAVTFVELGAGEGLFLERLHRSLSDDHEGTPVTSTIAVETADWARERIARRLPDVTTAARLADVRRPAGAVILFASELYDAFPAHRVTLVREGHDLVLREYFVAAEGENLVWRLDPPSRPEIERHLVSKGIGLEEEQVVEVRPELQALHESHLAWAGEDGVFLTIEYGADARKLYNARARRQGTLVGYRLHRVVRNVLESPGEIDITAHVDFDDLDRAADAHGWEWLPVQPLGAFLALAGAVEILPEEIGTEERLTPAQWAAVSGAKRLLAPGGIGSDLKVLCQGRGRVWQAFCQAVTPPPVDA